MALSRTHQRCRHPWPFRRVIHGIHVEIIAFENPLSINVRFSVENPLICYPLENPWQLNGTSNFHIIEVNVCEFSTKKSLQKSRYIKIRLSHLFPSIFQLHDFAAIRFPSHGIPSAFSWDPRTRSNL